MERQPSGSGSHSGGRAASRRPHTFEMDIVDEPAPAIGSDDRHRKDHIAPGSLQLHAEVPQPIQARYILEGGIKRLRGERPFDDAISFVIEILLHGGEVLAQAIAIPKGDGGSLR